MLCSLMALLPSRTTDLYHTQNEMEETSATDGHMIGDDPRIVEEKRAVLIA